MTIKTLKQLIEKYDDSSEVIVAVNENSTFRSYEYKGDAVGYDDKGDNLIIDIFTEGDK